MEDIKPGIYQHFKGNIYEVVGVALHSETMEELVIYRSLYDSEKFGKNTLWARPKVMFFETVTVDGKKVPRFKYIRKKI